MIICDLDNLETISEATQVFGGSITFPSFYPSWDSSPANYDIDDNYDIDNRAYRPQYNYHKVAFAASSGQVLALSFTETDHFGTSAFSVSAS